MVNYFLVLEGEREITVLGTFLQVDEIFRHDGFIQLGVELELDVFRIVIRKVEFRGNRASNLLGLCIHRLCDKLALKSFFGCQVNGKIFVFLILGCTVNYFSKLHSKPFQKAFTDSIFGVLLQAYFFFQLFLGNVIFSKCTLC